MAITHPGLRGQLERSRLYFPARNAFNVVRPAAAGRRRCRLAFLRTVLEPGMLVFDIGANIGQYAELYQALGCRVVAVEPQPHLAALIASRLPRVTVEQTAVGARIGTADLQVGAAHWVATLSHRYAQIVRETIDPNLRPLQVPVTTVDALADKHGRPNYVKIDVEGFEQQVIAGMTQPPGLVSFEFHCSMLDEADACMRALDGYCFSVTLEESFKWDLREGSRAEALARLEKLRRANPGAWGDVYARAASHQLLVPREE